MAKSPGQETVKQVVADVLAAVGTDQMAELYDAIDDLLWDHYEPYQDLPDEQRAAWREAFRTELEGGYS